MSFAALLYHLQYHKLTIAHHKRQGSKPDGVIYTYNNVGVCQRWFQTETYLWEEDYSYFIATHVSQQASA